MCGWVVILQRLMWKPLPSSRFSPFKVEVCWPPIWQKSYVGFLRNIVVKWHIIYANYIFRSLDCKHKWRSTHINFHVQLGGVHLQVFATFTLQMTRYRWLLRKKMQRCLLVQKNVIYNCFKNLKCPWQKWKRIRRWPASHYTRGLKLTE